MNPRHPIRPAHRLVVLFAALTLVPSVLLVAFGWRLLQQERVIELAETQTRRQQTADLVIASLEQTLTDAERQLRDPENAAAGLGSGAVILIIDRSGVAALPSGRVLYSPASPTFPEPRPSVFDTLDAAEYRSADSNVAVRVARQLASSPDPAIRGAALVRLARILRGKGESEAALQTYSAAAAMSGVGFDNVPVSLFARWARCGLLEEIGRAEQLRNEAAALHADLLRGQWVIGRSVFELHLADASRWAGAANAMPPAADVWQMTAAVEQLYTAFRSAVGERRHRGTMTASGGRFTILVSERGGRTAILAASDAYVQRQWLTKAAAILESQALRALIGAPLRADAAEAVIRTAAETNLPWTLVFEPVRPLSRADGFSARQRLWTAGLVVLAALSLTGTWIVARAVNRELAVARLQSDFVAAVSHEFRTPLTTMGQLTEVLMDGRAGDEARRRRYYEALGRQTQRLRRLVENLLDFARMEADRSPYRFQAFESVSWAGSTVTQFAADPASGDHHMHLDVPPYGVSVSGDREALTNALWNLLDNAVKYSPGAEDVWVALAHRGPRLEISVRDAGVGIPAEERHEIFVKFVRGRRARADNIKGTGIGLAMVRHVVDAHGGTVTVSSSEGGGSTFTIVLPGASAASVDHVVACDTGTAPVYGADTAAPSPVAAENEPA